MGTTISLNYLSFLKEWKGTLFLKLIPFKMRMDTGWREIKIMSILIANSGTTDLKNNGYR